MSSGKLAASWLTAIGTVGAVMFALFQDWYHRWLRHPALEVSIKTGPPDCVLIPFWRLKTFQANITPAPTIPIKGDSYYFRIKVKNTGKETARNVEVYAKSLKVYKDEESDWKIVPEFPPMNLIWSNSTPQTRIYLPYLEPETEKHCDVGHIVEPAIRKDVGEENEKLKLKDAQASLTFDLVDKPAHMGHVVAPGRYKLEIVVAAENAAAVTKTILLNFDGTWTSIEDDMLGKNVELSIA